MTNEIKLKPCPFCGGEGDCNNTGLCTKDGESLWWVECGACGVSTSGHQKREMALEAWNRRTGGEP